MRVPHEVCTERDFLIFNVGFVWFSIFCGLLVFTCLVATIMEVLCKPVKVEIVEKCGHISMDEDAKEQTPLLSDGTAKVEKDKGKI